MTLSLWSRAPDADIQRRCGSSWWSALTVGLGAAELLDGFFQQFSSGWIEAVAHGDGRRRLHLSL